MLSFCDEQDGKKHLLRLDRSRRLRKLKRKWIPPRWASELNWDVWKFFGNSWDFQSF